FGGAAWFIVHEYQSSSPSPPTPAPAVTAKAPVETGPRNPVPPGTADATLPALKESDPAILEALGSFLGADAFRRFIVPEDVVRRIVATVDNLPREEYSSRVNPVVIPGGAFRASGSGGNVTIAPANSARYAAHVQLLQSIDAKAAADLYRRFYPLSQEAYVQLGYPNAYFNDRLVEAIDDLLAAPEIPPSTKLVTPHVLYEFADPALEKRSSGQKVLMRMGNDN